MCDINSNNLNKNQPTLNTQDDESGGCVISVARRNGDTAIEVLTFNASQVLSKEAAIGVIHKFFDIEGMSVPPEEFAMFVLEQYAENIEQCGEAGNNSMFAGLIAALLETSFWAGKADNTTGEKKVMAATKEEFEHWQKRFEDEAKAGKLDLDTKHSTTHH